MSWDTVYDRLLAQLPTWAGTTNVHDGWPSHDLETQFVVLGDTGDGTGDAGTFSWDYENEAQLTEVGTVNVLIGAQSGNSNARAALRSTVKTMRDGITAGISADKRLGVLSNGYVNVSAASVFQPQTAKGAVVQQVLTVSYETRV